jgi:hypothetical protein
VVDGQLWTGVCPVLGIGVAFSVNGGFLAKRAKDAGIFSVIGGLVVGLEGGVIAYWRRWAMWRPPGLGPG